MKTFRAYKKTYVSLTITIISIGLNFLFNSLLIERYGILGLTLSTSFVSLVNLIVLNFIQKKTFAISFLRKRETLIIFISSIGVFVVCYLLKHQINEMVWLLLSNGLFLFLFIMLNRTILGRILTRIKWTLKKNP